MRDGDWGGRRYGYGERGRRFDEDARPRGGGDRRDRWEGGGEREGYRNRRYSKYEDGAGRRERCEREWDRNRGRGTGRDRDRDRAYSRSRSPRSRSSSGRSVDSEGHISSDISQITERFEVKRELDRGTFGAVFKAYDTKHREYVAVKVVRRVKRYVEDAMVEVGILDQLGRCKGSKHYCVQLYKHFHYRGHLCIITELLGQSLYHAMKSLPARKSDGMFGVSLNALRHLSHQLCHAMDFLHKAGLVHADLKTENVLLVSPGMSLKDDVPKVKLIDFGAATWDKDTHGTIIQTRHYRAPEVVLGLDWSFPCDLWSVACIILELHEGYLTFDTHDTAQHLAMMQNLCGDIPREMASHARHGAEEYFDSHTNRLQWPEISGGGLSRPRDYELEDQAKAVKSLEERLSHPDLKLLHSLLDSLFRIDPSQRKPAGDTLSDPFFAGLQ